MKVKGLQFSTLDRRGK